MRITKEKAAENRERILKGASRLIRERGISGAGVDALTAAAGNKSHAAKALGISRQALYRILGAVEKHG